MLERFGIPRQFREMPQEKREATSYGSGFILKDNYILTNYHVVEDATEVIVSLSDRREFIAEIVGVDPLSDLALLKVEGKNLPQVTAGDSDKLKVGDWVVDPVGLYLIREDYEDLLLAANITKALDTRVELDGVIEGTRKNSLDPYAIMRTMYLQRRARLVANEESEDTSIYDIDIDVMLID